MKLDFPEATQFAEYEIGWRLVPEAWGQGYAKDAAIAWMEFGFGQLNLETIVSNAVRKNIASIGLMKRLGMTCVLDAFDHPDVPDSHRRLQPSVIYCTNAAE